MGVIGVIYKEPFINSIEKSQDDYHKHNYNNNNTYNSIFTTYQLTNLFILLLLLRQMTTKLTVQSLSIIATGVQHYITTTLHFCKTELLLYFRKYFEIRVTKICYLHLLRDEYLPIEFRDTKIVPYQCIFIRACVRVCVFVYVCM